MTKIQRPDVVEAENVIGMTMRYQHRVQMFEAGSEGLLPEVTRSVDNNRLPGVFD
jgi:hypothetical protein